MQAFSGIRHLDRGASNSLGMPAFLYNPVLLSPQWLGETPFPQYLAKDVFCSIRALWIDCHPSRNTEKPP